MKPYRISLTAAILSSLACLLVLTWLLLSLISFKTAEKDIYIQKNDEARVLLAAFIEALPASLEGLPKSSVITTFAASIAREKGFAGLLVVDAGSKPVYAVADRKGPDVKLAETIQTRRESFSYSRDGRYVFRYAPVFSGDTVVGAARLTLSFTKERERLAGSRRLFLAYFVLDFLLLLGFGSFMLSRVVVVPIKKLLAATKRIAMGDYRQTVHVHGSAEIAELADSFNTMVQALEDKRVEVEQTVHSLEQANKELQVAREESIRSEKMASIGLLAAGTAHEIGTPLAAIMGYAGILKDELKDDETKFDYIRRMEMESTRIDRIVRGLLDYARPARASSEAVDVVRLVRETVDLLEGQGALKHLKFSFTPDENVPDVLVDPHQLQQVLLNIILNARDAMPSGGTLHLGVCLRKYSDLKSHQQLCIGPSAVMGRRKDDFNRAFSHDHKNCALDAWVAVTVADTGEGIPKENLGRIFDPFFTTKPPGKGTGLGLAISARIIDSFGGRIVAESEVGKGTTFTVLLPVHEEGL